MVWKREGFPILGFYFIFINMLFEKKIENFPAVINLHLPPKNLPKKLAPYLLKFPYWPLLSDPPTKIYQKTVSTPTYLK